MSSELDAPNQPTPRRDEPRPSSTESPASCGGSEPSLVPPSTGSSDDLSTLLSQARPDPFLDPLPPPSADAAADSPSGDDPQAVECPPFPGLPTEHAQQAADGAGAAVAPSGSPAGAEMADPVDVVIGGPSADVALDLTSSSEDQPRYTNDAGAEPAAPADAGAEVLAWLASSVVAPRAEPTGGRRPLESDDGIPAIDVGALPASSPSPPGAGAVDDLDDEYEDEPPRGTSWLVVVLASYSSAVTLGLIWVLLGNRSLHDADDSEPEPGVAVAKADPGRRAENSRKQVPPPPLADNRITEIGKSVTTGGLEVTPIAVTSGSIRLHRAIGGEGSRDGGKNALKLRLRLRNASKDVIFAPLDEAFLREREAGVFDTFIELGDGTVMDMYPLSVFSEWEIDGQTFKELKPGEVFESEVVSVADGAARKRAEMTWRIRLRTGIDTTDVVGVKFRGDQVQSGP
jgi:hypothetical protein